MEQKGKKHWILVEDSVFDLPMVSRAGRNEQA